MTPTIRTAASADLPGILSLYRHLPVLDPTSTMAAWSALLSSGVNIPVVAELAGTLVSSCTLAMVPNMSRGARPYGVIENVVTDPAHRRAGLGRAVLHTALDIAWKADCYKVMLATGSKQEATLRFYEAAGFMKGGRTYFEARRI